MDPTFNQLMPTRFTPGRRGTSANSSVPMVLEIDLSLGLQSTAPQDPVAALRARNVPQLDHVLAGLRHGAKDNNIVAVVLHVTPRLNMAQAEELGAGLRTFRDSGKQVLAWTESFGELGPGTVGYYLATHADHIWMQPSGTVGLQGVGLQVGTIGVALAKVGVEPQFGQRHEYKTAAETYTASEISQPNREMTGRIAESVTEQVAAATAGARNLSTEQVIDATRIAPLPAEQAIERGLVDRLGYRDDVYATLRHDHGKKTEPGQEPQVRLEFCHRYANRVFTRTVDRARQRRRPVVAVIDVEGQIVTGRSRSPVGGGSQAAGSDSVTAALRGAMADDSVRAVVLRVDSPGGSYVASDAIRDVVARVRQTGRPVVASMGSVAASGGYFVSMGADRIVSLPSTMTGSIGVLGGKMVINQALDRIGVAAEAIGSASATMFSPARRFDDQEWSRVESWLDAVYDDFTRKAAEDRDLDYAALESNARGRVWTGADARDRGLVDELGGLQAAIAAACARIGVDRDQVRVQKLPHLTWLDRLRPPESTESPHVSALTAPPQGMFATITAALGIDGWGLLTMPWRFHLS